MASDQQGWKECHYKTLKPKPTAPAAPSDLFKFIKSQSVYVSQYYANIKWEISKAEVYMV